MTEIVSVTVIDVSATVMHSDHRNAMTLYLGFRVFRI